jgi:hypothetical protein
VRSKRRKTFRREIERERRKRRITRREEIEDRQAKKMNMIHWLLIHTSLILPRTPPLPL